MLIGYTQSAKLLKKHLSEKFGYLCNNIQRIKKWFLNRHLDKTKKRALKHELEKTEIIFSPKINTKSKLNDFLPGCWDCDVPPGSKRTEKCLSCKYIFHTQCLRSIEYDDMEFKFLSKCNFCNNND